MQKAIDAVSASSSLPSSFVLHSSPSLVPDKQFAAFPKAGTHLIAHLQPHDSPAMAPLPLRWCEHLPSMNTSRIGRCCAMSCDVSWIEQIPEGYALERLTRMFCSTSSENCIFLIGYKRRKTKSLAFSKHDLPGTSTCTRVHLALAFPRN